MSSPDDHRSSNIKGLKYQSTLNMLAMLLPGATVSYYGEEIGLLEMEPDDSSILKYTSQIGRAVCSDLYVSFFLHDLIISDFVFIVVLISFNLNLFHI